MKNGRETNRIERRSTSIVRLDIESFAGFAAITGPRITIEQSRQALLLHAAASVLAVRPPSRSLPGRPG